MISHNMRLQEAVKTVVAVCPSATPAANPAPWFNMGNYAKLAVVVLVANGAAPTAAKFRFEQACECDPSVDDILPLDCFSSWRNIDAYCTEELTADAPALDGTVDSDITPGKCGLYMFEIDGCELNNNSGFYLARLVVENPGDAIVSATYHGWPSVYGACENPALCPKKV